MWQSAWGGKRKSTQENPSSEFVLHCTKRQFYKVCLNLYKSLSNSALLSFLSHISLNWVGWGKSKLIPGGKGKVILVYRKANNSLGKGMHLLHLWVEYLLKLHLLGSKGFDPYDVGRSTVWRRKLKFMQTLLYTNRYSYVPLTNKEIKSVKA